MDKNIRSFNEKNSIQELTFVLHFDHPMDESTFEKLTSLQEIFKNEFQKFDEIKAVTVKITNDQNSLEKVSPVLAGLHFQRLNQAGKAEWILKIEHNYIAINCLVYRNWETAWKTAHKYFTVVSKELIDAYFFSSVSLQYINCFICSDIEKYRFDDIFNVNSVYLTQKMQSSGALWHLFQGWIDQIENEYYSLNQLNISASKEGEQHLTKIQTFKQALLETIYVNEENKKNVEFLSEVLETKLSQVMELLQGALKKIYKDIISTEMAQKLNLTDKVLCE